MRSLPVTAIQEPRRREYSLLAAMLFLMCGLAQPIAGDNHIPCNGKDIVVYLDISDSTTKVEHGASYLSLFSAALFHLLESKTHFLAAGDSLRFVWFADQTYESRQFSSWKSTDQTDLDNFLQRLKQPSAKDLWIGETPKTALTNLKSVFDHIGLSFNGNRQQIFIIASDLAHDPANQTCADPQERKNRFSDALQSFVTDLRNKPTGPYKMKIALLKADGSPVACSSDIEVGNYVDDRLRSSALEADSIRVLKYGGVDYVTELLKATASPPILTIDARDRLGPHDTRVVSTRVANANTFPITISSIVFTPPTGPAISQPVSKHIAICDSTAIPVTVPDKFADVSGLTVSAVSDFGTSSPVGFVSQGFAVSRTHVHLFGKFLASNTAVVVFEGLAQLDGEHRAEVGIANFPTKHFVLQPMHGAATIAFPVQLADDQAAKLGNRTRVSLKFESEGDEVMAMEDVADVSPNEGFPAAVKDAWLPHGIPIGTELAVYLSLLWGIFRWFLHGRGRFIHDVSTTHHLAQFLQEALASLIVWRLPVAGGIFPPSLKIGFIVWSLLGGLAFGAIVRQVCIAVVWRRRYEPDGRPLPARVAIQSRKELTGYILAFGLIAALICYVLLLSTIGFGVVTAQAV